MILINLLIFRVNIYPKFSYHIPYPALARIALSCQTLASVPNMPFFNRYACRPKLQYPKPQCINSA
jgi:hypothetical protein